MAGAVGGDERDDGGASGSGTLEQDGDVAVAGGGPERGGTVLRRVGAVVADAELVALPAVDALPALALHEPFGVLEVDGGGVALVRGLPGAAVEQLALRIAHREAVAG